MKKMLKLIFTGIFLIAIVGTLKAQSADTVNVPATHADGTPYFDSMVSYIAADTNADGSQKHFYYELNRGQFYILNQALVLKNPVEIFALPPVANDSTLTPPKVMSNIDSAGNTSTGNLIITSANITLKNLWLSGIDYGAVNHGWGQDNALTLNDSNITANLDNIWCDYNSRSGFGTTYPHTVWHITGLHARNEQNDGDQWTTFLFYLSTTTEVDTFTCENSTYFQSNSCFIFCPSVIRYIKINHCDFVNSYKWPFMSTQWLTAIFTNNIFYNSGSLGLTQTEAESQDPNGQMFGLIDVDTLFIHTKGGDTLAPGPYTIPENQRIVDVENNDWFYSSEIEAYLAAHDTVMHPVWMNARTKAMFADKTDWPGLTEKNTWNVDPQFDDFSTEAGGLTEANTLLAQACTDIRAGSTHGWEWDGDMNYDSTYWRLLIQYPTAENFKSYAGLIGTDGLPIGDLSYSGITGVQQQTQQLTPTSYKLSQNYPNPFNPSTTIDFSIAKAGHFTLNIYNVLGQKVATLINSNLSTGNHKVTFDASKLASGLYIYQLKGNEVNLTKKMMLLK